MAEALQAVAADVESAGAGGKADALRPSEAPGAAQHWQKVRDHVHSGQPRAQLADLVAQFGDSMDKSWDEIRRELEHGLEDIEAGRVPPPVSEPVIEGEAVPASFAAPDSPTEALAQQQQQQRAEVWETQAKLLDMAVKKVETYKARAAAAKERLREQQEDTARVAEHARELQGELDEARAELRRRPAGGGGAARAADNPHLASARQAEEELRAKRREEARRALFSGVDVLEDIDFDAAGANPLKLSQAFARRLLQLLARHYPLSADLRTIDSHYGSSVASYFAFFRWMIASYALLALLAGVGLLRHMLQLVSDGRSWTYSSAGAGLLPQVVQLPSYATNEKLAFTQLLVLLNLALLLSTLYKWVSEDRTAKQLGTREESNQFKFAQAALCAWEHGVDDAAGVEDQQMRLQLGLQVLVAEETAASEQRALRRRDRALLALRRAAGLLAYAVVQGLAWAAIVYLTAVSRSVQESLDARLQGTSLSQFAPTIAATVVPGSVSVINAAMPPVISAITAFERWPSERTVLRLAVTKMYLAKMLNVVIQAFSYMLLANPFLFAEDTAAVSSILRSDIREAVAVRFAADEYVCRLEQAGAGLVYLVLTEFFISKLITVGTPLAKQLLARALRRPAGEREEFHVARKMVSLLYFQALVLISVPLMPSAAGVALLLYWLTFKFDAYVLRRWQQKPLKPWSAKDAGAFFIKFHFVTVLLGLAGTHLFLSSQTLPKACSVVDDAVALCEAGSYDAASELCSLDAAHDQAAWFAAGATECAAGYPACTCSGALACGPFAYQASGYTPLEDSIKAVPVVGTVYSVFASSALVVWLLLCAVLLLALFRSNSLAVANEVAAAREVNLSATVGKLEKEVARLNTKLERQKLAVGGLGRRRSVAKSS